jgi:hypothetical protein
MGKIYWYPEEIDEEIHALCEALIASKGRLDHESRAWRTCPSCGNEFAGAMEFCPVCMLRKAVAGEVQSGESSSSSSKDAVKPTLEHAAQRFEHYELVTGEDGKPVELGRGAMGVTYKAVDVDLRYPVTLKVISEQYLGDESAQLCLLREARAATASATRMLPRAFTLGELGAVTSTRWSLWREKRSRPSSNAPADLR